MLRKTSRSGNRRHSSRRKRHQQCNVRRGEKRSRKKTAVLSARGTSLRAEVNKWTTDIKSFRDKSSPTKYTNCLSSSAGIAYRSCGPICLNKACSSPSLCYLLSDERSLVIPSYLTIFPHPSPLPPPLLTCLYIDRSSNKRYHKVGFEKALFKHVGPQLLYGLPVVRLTDECKKYCDLMDMQNIAPTSYQNGYVISTWMAGCVVFEKIQVTRKWQPICCAPNYRTRYIYI